MRGFKIKGDVKEVVLFLKAIDAFNKTVKGFVEKTKHYTEEERNRYKKLVVACYKQMSKEETI